MKLPDQLRKTWAEWTSPRYSRIKFKLDPSTKELLAETELDPPTTKHDQFRLIVYTGVIILAVIIVTALFFNHTNKFKEKTEESEIKYDELYKQNGKQLEESMRKLELQQQELARTRQELNTLQNLNKELVQNSKKQAASLEKKIADLQDENESLVKKIQDISSGKKGPAPKLTNSIVGPENVEPPLTADSIPNPDKVLSDKNETNSSSTTGNDKEKK